MSLANPEQMAILVVDDNPTNLRVLSETLAHVWGEILVAIDGNMALEQAEYAQPDLILLDVMLPGIDGFETCRRLKANPLTTDIPIIFMTALAETVDKVQGLSLGAVDYITKPFQQEEVLARVRVHLELRHLAKKLEQQNQQLKQEVKARAIAETALQQLNAQLEQRVSQRTVELETTNQDLKQEIVERRRVEAELIDAKEAAEVGNRTKSEFLANMSHELRTPLNAILGFTQLLARDLSLNPEQQKKLEIIGDSGKRLLTMINDILAISKSEAGKLSLHETSFDLHVLLANLEKMLQFETKSKGLSLSVELTSEVPQYVTTDQGKLYQVLTNLLENAIKFTTEGSIKLRVQVIPGSQCLRFEVEDTGLGIEPEGLNHLFEPFTQTSAGQKSGKGTGLGLAISQKFVQLMKSHITVSSEVNQGTIFRFDLPVNLAQSSQLSTQSNTQLNTPYPWQQVIGFKGEQSGYRILVADSQKEIRERLKNLLSPLGFEVREAENGRDAVTFWSVWEPHLIWMDMYLPVVNGYVASKQIRAAQKGQATVIIALMEMAAKEQHSIVFLENCNDFVSKPFQEMVIFEKMATHLGLSYIYNNANHGENDVSQRKKPALSSYLNLQPSDLSVMSVEWVAELRQAAIAARENRLLNLVAQIPKESASLADSLTQLISNVSYDKIIDLTMRKAIH